jgi:hypothetical protein
MNRFRRRCSSLRRASSARRPAGPSSARTARRALKTCACCPASLRRRKRTSTARARPPFWSGRASAAPQGLHFRDCRDGRTGGDGQRLSGGVAELAVAGGAMGVSATRRVLSARAMVNPRVSRWLAESVSASTPAQAKEATRKLGVIIAREPAIGPRIAADLPDAGKQIGSSVSRIRKARRWRR